jgi:response regulator RpfG family c-di-GMP phosphodiesterase
MSTAARRVLIVDDDRTFCQMLSEVLTDAGFDTACFHSGPEVLGHLKASPDASLMLLDVQMPGMSGVEVVRSVQEQPARPSVVLMTAHASLQTAIECLRLGAEDYITKPFDLDLLMLTLERATERDALRRTNGELERLLTENRLDYQRNQAALRKLADILRLQVSTRDFPQTAMDILRLTHELLQSDLSSICLRGDMRGLTYHIPASGISSSHREEIEKVLNLVIATGRMLLGDDPGTDRSIFPERFFDLFANSVVIPIEGEKLPFGALHVARSQKAARFTTTEVQLLELLCAEISILHANARLYENYERMTIGAITSLANAVHYKDGQTAEHALRTQMYVSKTFDELKLSKPDRDLITFAMRLHDIGKIRVPNSIISKPGPLDDDEWDVMRMHPVWGYDILNCEGMLAEVAVLVRHHHERFDGTGYPDQLKGNNIPLGSRVLSVVDAFDAMRSNRPYRSALPVNHAVDEIRTNLGTQFDPDIGEVFLRCVPAPAV